MQKAVVRKRRPTPLSEYGRQLAQKQELRNQYNLKEHQFAKYVKETLAKKIKGDVTAAQVFIERLERRLDNIVFRSGIADTRSHARQMVSHGHFMVNGKRTRIPSYETHVGNVISVVPSALGRTLFKNILLKIKKYNPPAWLEVNKETLEITRKGVPSLQELGLAVEVPLIFEFYSR
ncbi:MAG: 30S ribosomal protein S4 [bacterium]|nr:30S ribosomal protein S4 [bacterium]